MEARPFLSRFGCFLVVIGSFLLILGVAAAVSDQPALGIILGGVFLSALGFAFWRGTSERSGKPTRRSRFRRRRPDSDSQDSSEQREMSYE